MSTEPRFAPLIDWLIEKDLLRGPFAFSDYWSSVLDLQLGEDQRPSPYVDRKLFRVGLDRPDLEVPRRRFYFLMYLVGPLLLPFRRLRRLGRYRVRFRRDTGESVRQGLAPYRLELESSASGRVTVRAGPDLGGDVLAEDLLDPRVVAGFTSLFLATYKLAIASLISILLVAIVGPWLITTGRLEAMIPFWIPLGFPALALVLGLLFRDWITGVLGALPVIFGRFLVGVLGTSGGWLPFAAALIGLFVLYVAIDWLFVPRPVPPVLMLYRTSAESSQYARPGDAPYWLEGESYWVWRYLMLSPAELNKFWERDWERIEIWVRADGPSAGALEWVVTDAHYRELWIPFEGLGAEERLERQRSRALEHAQAGDPGLWLVEVDAHPVFHTPYVRTVSFIPERDEIHVQSLAHLLSALFARRRRDDPDDYIPALDRLRIETGREILGDIPELVAHLSAREMLATPWHYWRYPLGAQRKREERLYDGQKDARLPPASDPLMQIKAPSP